MTPRDERCIVWIVEDSPLEATLAARVLAGEFRVVVFSEAASVVEQLGTASELPDLILTDWVLPGIDGIELCRMVRATYDELAMPVMIVTAREGHHTRLEALESRVNDVIAKPFEPRELRARVRILTRTRRLHLRSTQLEGAVEMFVGTVSHDLRTPLNAMSGYAQLMLSRGDLPEKHQQWAQRIVTVGGRMARMLDELVEVTEVRGGSGVQLARSLVDLGVLAESVAEEILVAHPTAAITCSASGENEGLWDADRLSRVVQNLLGNAVNHGAPESPISVAVTSVGEDSVLVVHNQGRPVPELLRASLFDPFRRSRPNGGKGLGLGLYITRELVKAHGGEISFTSSAEEGTTFTVRLPRTAVPPALGTSPRPLA